jgi:pimeloyl-ACP methyl ester carboxylesterase
MYQSDGTALAYDETGAGRPVVFLHPTPLDRDYWRLLTAELAGVRAIVPDFRGHGASQLGTMPVGGFSLVPDAPVLSVAQLAADVIALLDHLDLPDAVFAGCSIGGYVLLELWRKAPDRVRGVAFVCSKPQPDTPADLVRRAGLIAKARAGGSETIFDGMTQTLIGASARESHPEIMAQLRSRMTLTPEALVAVQAGLAERPDSVSTVATINVPLLAIAGGEDPGVSFAEMEVFRSARSECMLRLIPDAGHFAAYEQPAQVAALLSEWMQSFDD